MTENIVEFKDDGPVSTTSKENYKTLDGDLIDHVISEMAIKDFLKRPVFLARGKFQTTDTVSTSGFDLGNWPKAILSSIPMWTEKLKGYYGLRATLTLRLVANPNPFQQGRYMMSYIPCAGSVYNTDVWLNSHITTLVQRSQLPHVEFDLQCDTEAILKVPFVSSRNFYCLNSGALVEDVIARIRIFPYEPFATGTGTNFCTWTVFASMDDVELIAAAIPQSGPSEFEQVKGKIGPIGLSLRKIKQLADTLSPVPLLSSYAIPVSWAADVLSRTAYVFGWSKPMITCPPTKVVRDVVPFLGNVDGADSSKSLGFYSNNHIEQIVGFCGTDVDEMDFSHFLSIPTYHQTVTWSDASVQNALLFNVTLCPTVFNSVPISIGSGRFAINHSPMAFLGTYFNLYRGSIKLRFKLVKTKFHSGRLEVCYNPWDVDGGQPPLTPDNPWVMKHIIDIRTTSEFVIEFPFVSKYNYLKTTAPYGTVVIYVLEGLTAPSTCSNTVKVIVESMCCPDFEFAQPNTASLFPVAGIAPQSGCMNFEESIGSSSCDYSMKHARASIGESIRSLRQLLRFSSRISYVPLDKPDPPTGIKTFSLLPYGVQWITPYNGAAYFNPRTSCDLYGTLSSMFALSRGGVKFKLIAPGISQNRITVTASPTYTTFYNSVILNDVPIGPGLSTESGPASYNWTTSLPQQLFLTNYQGVEVMCPQYSEGHSRNCAEHSLTSTGNPTTYSYVNSVATDIQVNIISDAAQNLDGFKIYRTGSDDCTLGCFVSIPPMTMSLVYGP